MSSISSDPLSQDEQVQLESILLEHGNDDSILSLSELDGFLTGLASGPHALQPSDWFSTVWGGNEPEWKTQQQVEQFLELLFRFQNQIIDTLTFDENNFSPLFLISETGSVIAEDWCFGYIKAVELGNWSALPAELKSELANIELHGKEANFELLDTMSDAEICHSINAISPAVIKLHRYWLKHRTTSIPAQNNEMPVITKTPTTPASSPYKIGRNDPCFCGSGKKFKKCCLS